MAGDKYSSLKKSYDSAVKAVRQKTKEVSKINLELDELQAAGRNMAKDFQKAYAQEENEAAKAYKVKILAPFEQKVENAEKQLQACRLDFETEMSKLTEENLIEQCSTQQEILEEVKDASGLIQQRLEDAIGERFCRELAAQLNVSEIALKQKDIDRVIQYFNKCDAKLQKMSSGPDVIGQAITNAEHAMHGIDGSSLQLGKKHVTAAACVLLVFAFLAYRYVFPFYVVLLGFVASYNLYRSYLVYKIMIVHKVVKDNVVQIEEFLHEQVRNEVEARKAELSDYYNSKISSLESEIQDYKKQLADASVTAEGSFEFDDSDVRDLFNRGKKRNEEKTLLLMRKKDEAVSKLNSLNQEAEELKEALRSLMGDLKYEYLNFDTAGSDYILRPDFLFDIDDRHQKPVFFKHPEDSCLILYESRNEAVDFIKLLCVQIRANLSPKFYTMTYYDDKTLGRDCIYFVPEVEKDSAMVKLFQILTTSEDLKGTVMSYAMEMRKRQKELREDRNIKKYNAHMLELESMTMSYIFGFWLDIPTDVAASADMTLLLRSAGAFGILLHLFVQLGDLYEMGKNAKGLVDSAQKIYVIQDGVCQARAKDYVLDKMVKK